MYFVSLQDGSSNLQNQSPSRNISISSFMIRLRIYSHSKSYQIMVVFLSDSQDIFGSRGTSQRNTSKVRLSISRVVHSNQDGVRIFDMFDVLKNHLLGLFINQNALKTEFCGYHKVVFCGFILEISPHCKLRWGVDGTSRDEKSIIKQISAM